MSDISKKTLLLVEDEIVTAEIISALLRKNGFDVIPAASGKEAIRIVNSGQTIHLILMDIILECNMDGIEAAKSILQDHDIPLIFLSGHSDTEILQRTEEIASYGYVLKHSDYPILIASIKMALNLHEARRRAEDALKKREIAFRAMFADNPIPMLVYEPETLKILEVNMMAVNHYGYTRDEFLKMTIADMRPAEDIPKLMKKVSEVGKGVSKTGVWRHLKRDGTLIHVEITSHSIDYLGKNARLVLVNDVTEKVRAEEKLQQQYAMLQSIIESTDALIFSIDNNGLYTSFNKSHAAIMKLANGENIELGKNILDYIRDETEREIIKQNLGRTLQGESFSTEHLINTYPPMIFEIIHNPIRSVSGDVVGAAVFARDITERKQTECSIKESETFFRLMFDNNPIPMWIYDSETLRFLEVNEAALKNYGYTRDEFLSITASDIRPAEDAQEFMRFISKLPKGSNKSDIRRHRRKDGTVIYVETLSDTMDFLGKNARFMLANDITERIVYQQKLTESRQRLTLALKGAKAGVWEWDMLTRKGFWTEENYRIMGSDPGKVEPCYESWLNAVHPEDREHVEAVILKSLEDYRNVEVEFRVILPDTAIRWIRYLGQFLFDPSGNPYRMIGLQLDVTDQKQAEEEMSDQYSILRSIMESVDAAVFSLDRGFRYTSFNMNHACIMKALYGADIEVGKNILDYMTDEEDRNKAEQAIHRALWGERFTIEDYSGNELRSRRYFEISHNPIKTQFGKLLGVVVFARDITERKNRDEELQRLAMELDRRVTERTAEVHDLYNNAPCGYHSLDADGLIVRMNDTALNWLGYTREEIIGKKTFDQMICNPRIFIENFSDFKQSGSVKDLEFKMVRKDGSVFPALLSATAIKDSEGKYLMSRSTMFDITEFKKIDQKLRESEERFRVAIKILRSWCSCRIKICDIPGYITSILRFHPKKSSAKPMTNCCRKALQ